VSPEKQFEILDRQRTAIKRMLTIKSGDPEFSKWRRDTEVAIEKIFGAQSRNVSDFKHISFSLSIFTSSTTDSQFEEAYRRGLRESDAILLSMIEEIENYREDAVEGLVNSSISTIEQICLKFHRVARQLQSRHSNRQTISIEDEYDVQDLFHALLKLFFDDIRPEEWTPSYAGGSSRVDFLIKDEDTVVEIKKTRNSLNVAKLGSELITDIARYEHHPNCKKLICFIYDPEGKIGNPVGLERDLEGHAGKLPVRVIVGPKS
jgi:REase_DpnII-MboI